MINEIEVHPASLLGKARKQLADLEARREAMAGLLAQHQEQLGDINGTLAMLPPTVGAAEVVELLASESAIKWVARRVEGELSKLDAAVRKAGGQVTTLEQRWRRIKDGLAVLSSDDSVLPYSPAERKVKLVEGRYKLCAIAGPPKDVDGLRRKLAEAPAMMEVGESVIVRADDYVRDLRALMVPVG